MGRILSLLLGAAALFGVAYRVLTGPSADVAPETPPQKLQQAREAAKRIEAADQQRADDALERSKAD